MHFTPNAATERWAVLSRLAQTSGVENFGRARLLHLARFKAPHYMQHPPVEFCQSPNVAGEGLIASVRSAVG